MADFYPELFPTRKHVLNFLFCTVGNGYEWINGELIDVDGEYEKRYKLRELIEKAEFKEEEYWNQISHYYQIKNKYEKHMIPHKYNFEWYPPSKDFSKMYNYPDDIKSE